MTEIRRIDPLRAANVSAVVNGALMTVFVLLMAPFYLLGVVLGAMHGGFGAGGGGLFGFVLLLYPIFGLVVGWIGGLVGAVAYNLVVRWTGGVRVELASVAVPDAPVAGGG